MMRNKERIPQFCNFLALKWERYFPDWRFGQLMTNFLGWHIGKYGDPFFPEDDVMEQRFGEFVNEMTGGK